MFNMYRKRYYSAKNAKHAMGSQEELGHDRFNYKNPKVNYDKWPRKMRHRRAQSTSRQENGEEEENLPVGLRHCQGSLREHQRLLALRADTHKCSPKCQVKNKTNAEGADALAKMMAWLNVQPKFKFGANRVPKEKERRASSARSKHYGTSLDGECSYQGSSSSSGISESYQTEVTKPDPTTSTQNRYLATNLCYQYMRSSGRYVLLDHLQDIGSRVEKQWFFIRDTNLKTERIFTATPLLPSALSCYLTDTSATTHDALMDLFSALQHPYIYPVLDVDIVYGLTSEDATKPALITVIPFNSKGSLKDLIYKSRWQDSWFHKYRQRSVGLPLKQVQRIGRQILEALIFLKNKGFPSFGHLHSGNVMMQNGVARLSGLENTLFGHTSRVYPLIKNLIAQKPGNAIETVCFGHVLFEMCAGYELCMSSPTQRQMNDIREYPQVMEVIDYIFKGPTGECPSIESLSLMDFFRNIDLREMRCSTNNSFFNQTSPDATKLIDQVLNRSKRKNCSSQNNSTVFIREVCSPFVRKAQSLNSFGLFDDSDQEDSYKTPDDSPRKGAIYEDLSQFDEIIRDLTLGPSCNSKKLFR